MREALISSEKLYYLIWLFLIANEFEINDESSLQDLKDLSSKIWKQDLLYVFSVKRVLFT